MKKYLFCIGVALTMAGSTAWSAPSALSIVENKRPQVTLVVPREAGPQQQEAARQLQSFIEQSTGAKLPIENARGTIPAIHVGRSPYVDGLKLKLNELDADGFVLKGVDAKNYVIVGPSDWGTEFGVNEFLERYVGVRWLFPTEIGTDVPPRVSLSVPTDEVREQPVFFSRAVSPLHSPIDTTPAGEAGRWGRRMRLHSRLNFSHNLFGLFPPSRYAKTHPQFYPLINGKRYIPKDDSDLRWQPNFSEPELVTEAVKNIKQFFHEHPEAPSYALGINDVVEFDESPASLARESGKKNYLGLRDVSDSYFLWANAVVTEVLKEYPDKWFGVLAYNNVGEPPTRVPVHPRIVPFLTYDRMKWIDPELETFGKELHERWRAKASQVGWYDYVYGFTYMVPRVYPHKMQEYMQWGAQHGVRAQYAELYPNWGEGPKGYVLLKLMWNPHQDVDALLDNWYRRCVGEKAAPQLREYYAIWERFWTQNILQSKWFTKPRQYLSFYDPGYLADVRPADLQRSRALLTKCIELADTPQRKARATMLFKVFEFYEASALAYRAETMSRTAQIDSAAAAPQLLETAPPPGMAAKRWRLMLEYENDPLLALPRATFESFKMGHVSWGESLMWRMTPWVAQSAEVRSRIETMAKSEDADTRHAANLVLQMAGGKGTPVTQNPSFESEKIAPWVAWNETPTGSLELSRDRAATGAQSLLARGIKRGGPYQQMPYEAGRYYARARIWTPVGGALKGTATLTLQIRDAQSKVLTGVWALPDAVATLTPGQWSEVYLPFTLPENTKGEAKSLWPFLILNGFAPDDQVYIDDFAVFRLPDSPA